MTPGESLPDVRGCRVLIVDDEPDNVQILQRLLRIEGFAHVRGTTDSRRVVGLFEEERVDLLLLDIRMPHLDGFALLERLGERGLLVDTAVVVLSAEVGGGSPARALKLGARDFIGKPFDVDECFARVRNMLELLLLQRLMRQRNLWLEGEVQAKVRELVDTRLEIIRRLTRAAEYRDYDTGNHILRMSRYCALLGEAIGLDRDACQLLLNATPMHDVGKIGIPDRILLKPGRLDPDEWAVMKTHVQIGHELLGGDSSELLRAADEIALTHHERWDGTGYPAGLAGPAIPLNGRICAVGDVYDALTSVRPYKLAWTHEEALALLSRERGRHFDPELIDAWHAIEPAIRAVATEFAPPDPIA